MKSQAGIPDAVQADSESDSDNYKINVKLSDIEKSEAQQLSISAPMITPND